jgi:hypothetical protein
VQNDNSLIPPLSAQKHFASGWQHYARAFGGGDRIKLALGAAFALTTLVALDKFRDLAVAAHGAALVVARRALAATANRATKVYATISAAMAYL